MDVNAPRLSACRRVDDEHVLHTEYQREVAAEEGRWAARRVGSHHGEVRSMKTPAFLRRVFGGKFAAKKVRVRGFQAASIDRLSAD